MWFNTQDVFTELTDDKRQEFVKQKFNEVFLTSVSILQVGKEKERPVPVITDPAPPSIIQIQTPKRQPLTSEIMKNELTLLNWIASVNAMVKTNTDWRSILLDLCKGHDHFLAIIANPDVTFDQFCDHLKESSKPVAQTTKTEHLHGLMSKLCQDHILPNHLNHLGLYSTDVLKNSTEKFMKHITDSTKTPKLKAFKESMLVAGDLSEPQKTALTEMLNEYLQLGPRECIISDGIQSLLGTTLDAYALEQNHHISDYSQMQIVTISSQINSRDATVRFQSTDQDKGWKFSKDNNNQNNNKQDKKDKNKKIQEKTTPASTTTTNTC